MSPKIHRDFGARRPGSPRVAFILAVSGTLGIVTFTLVYLSTMSFLSG